MYGEFIISMNRYSEWVYELGHYEGSRYVIRGIKVA